MGWGTAEDNEIIAKQHFKHLADLKRERRRQVRIAYKVGNKVGYSLGTLIEDGHSMKVILAVYRGES